MRPRIKTAAIPFPLHWIAFGFFCVLALLLVSRVALGADHKPESCKRVETIDAQITRYRNLQQQAQGNPDLHSQVDAYQQEITKAEGQKIEQQYTCDQDNQKYQSDQAKCNANHTSNPGLYVVDSDGYCSMKEVGSKNNPNEGECNNAELLRGTNLRGEACKNTAQTIKDVTAQQEAVTGATTAAATAYASYQATAATGAQQDAQLHQQQTLRALAMSKMITGGLQLAGAAQLKSAAGNATSASSGISEAHSGLVNKCNEVQNSEGLSSEQCFYKYAPQYGVDGNAKELSNFERLQSASVQTKDEADRANQMATTSMVSGLADAFVGFQAYKLSQQAQDNATAMGAPPPMPVPGYSLGGASQGGLSNPGLMPGTAGNGGPTDFGNGYGPTTLGDGGGPISNSIAAGGGYAPIPTKGARSSVSTSGGGGVGGAGGGSGGSRTPPRNPGPSNTHTGEINLAGGGGGGFHGGSGPAEKGEGGNAFAEALAKLFPQGADGKPVVETRGLASENPQITEENYAGSDVQAVDLSLFEQISAKYRQLSNNGNI
jgi:hypothetical protein